MEEMVLYLPGGDRILMRSIALKTNVQELLVDPADLKAGFQSSHFQNPENTL
jgi:hypothetical protein